MVCVGNHDQVEVLVRLDQRIHDEQRVVHRHVVVHRAVREQEMAFQICSEVLIGLHVVVALAIGANHLQATVLFIPVVFILAVIVIAALCYTHLEEIRKVKHRGDRCIAATGVSPDAHAR